MEELLNHRFLPAIIVVFSVLAAFIVDFLFRVVFRAFASKTKTNLDDNLIDILHKPIFYSAFFISKSTLRLDKRPDSGIIFCNLSSDVIAKLYSILFELGQIKVDRIYFN